MAETVVRLQRRGSKHRPFYHVVVADSRSPRDGKFIEKIGYYDPNCEPSLIQVDEDRAQFWYGRGAQLSKPVQTIMKAKKMKLSRKVVAPKGA